MIPKKRKLTVTSLKRVVCALQDCTPSDRDVTLALSTLFLSGRASFLREVDTILK